MYLSVTQLCTFIVCRRCFYESAVFGMSRAYNPALARIGAVLHDFYERAVSHEYEIVANSHKAFSLEGLRTRYREVVLDVLEEYKELSKKVGAYNYLLRTAEKIVEVNPLILYGEARRRGVNELLISLEKRLFNKRLISYRYELVGRVDIMEEYGPLEIKFSRTNLFKPAHKLQLIWYAIMAGKNKATLLLLPELKSISLNIDYRLKKWAYTILCSARKSLEAGSADHFKHTCVNRGFVVAK